jgi:hypothetical protein
MNREYAIRKPMPANPKRRADDLFCRSLKHAMIRNTPERNKANANVNELMIYLVE